jgi:hypothetical protein
MHIKDVRSKHNFMSSCQHAPATYTPLCFPTPGVHDHTIRSIDFGSCLAMSAPSVSLFPDDADSAKTYLAVTQTSLNNL